MVPREPPDIALLVSRNVCPPNLGGQLLFPYINSALHKKYIVGAHRAPLQLRTPSCRGGL